MSSTRYNGGLGNQIIRNLAIIDKITNQLSIYLVKYTHY